MTKGARAGWSTAECVGLRGGTFTTTELDQVTFRLDDLRWIENLGVSGKVSWYD
jgi:hypothetical protein